MPDETTESSLPPVAVRVVREVERRAAVEVERVHVRGLELRERWADWHRAPFTSESRSHVSVWELPR